LSKDMWTVKHVLIHLIYKELEAAEAAEVHNI
jgi:hypothetical protein